MMTEINCIVSKLIAVLSIAAFLNSCDRLQEEVSISDIPSYYFDNGYLDNRVKSINDAISECAGNSETFFWITDIHWEQGLNAHNSPLLIKYIASKTGVNKVLNGGDNGNSQVVCENAIEHLRNAIGSNKVYAVTGNHEIVDASGYERPFMRVADELRGHNTDIVYGDADKSYFFFDNQADHIRYVGLSTFGLYHDKKCDSCYTGEQLAWLKNTALNVAAGWTIIIFTHSLYYVKIDSNKLVISPTGAENFIDAIDEYDGNGTIASVFMGHSHKDRIHIGKTGIPYIISACDRYMPYKGDINVERIQGTTSEQHFEVVVIDKGKRQIKLFSIGANARDGYDDDSGREVSERTVCY